MQLRFARVRVKNQEQALAFYTGKLGFAKKADLMMGTHRFLTVAAPNGIEGVQLILESTGFPPSAVYQEACYKAGIPALSINTDDIARDYAALKARGVRFVDEPEDEGPVICATFDDDCGNLIYLVQAKMGGR
jgi:catechol 2,3-dioxygenase-like lactoylglutathione lyase family enzyme